MKKKKAGTGRGEKRREKGAEMGRWRRKKKKTILNKKKVKAHCNLSLINISLPHLTQLCFLWYLDFCSGISIVLYYTVCV